MLAEQHYQSVCDRLGRNDHASAAPVRISFSCSKLNKKIGRTYFVSEKAKSAVSFFGRFGVIAGDQAEGRQLSEHSVGPV